MESSVYLLTLDSVSPYINSPYSTVLRLCTFLADCLYDNLQLNDPKFEPQHEEVPGQTPPSLLGSYFGFLFRPKKTRSEG
jgi:hypothetical protein